MWFNTIKTYYNDKMQGYDKEGIKIFVVAKMITEKNYKEITNEDYTA